MPRLKAENPSLRQSQLKQMLRKEWQKSPENPLNQRIAALGSKVVNVDNDDDIEEEEDGVET